MRKLIFILLAVLVVLPLSAQSTKNLTYDDPIYTFIDKCYTKGWIFYVPDVKPYTEKRAMEYLKEVMALYKEHPEKFAEREVQELEQYMKRLEGDKFNLFHHQAGKFGVDANLAPHVGVNTNVAKMKDSSVVYGKDTKLSACSFKRPGYFFMYSTGLAPPTTAQYTSISKNTLSLSVLERK